LLCKACWKINKEEDENADSRGQGQYGAEDLTKVKEYTNRIMEQDPTVMAEFGRFGLFKLLEHPTAGDLSPLLFYTPLMGGLLMRTPLSHVDEMNDELAKKLSETMVKQIKQGTYFEDDDWANFLYDAESFNAEMEELDDSSSIIRNQVGDMVGMVELDENDEDIEKVDVDIIDDDGEMAYEGTLGAESFDAETEGYCDWCERKFDDGLYEGNNWWDGEELCLDCYQDVYSDFGDVDWDAETFEAESNCPNCSGTLKAISERFDECVSCGWSDEDWADEGIDPKIVGYCYDCNTVKPNYGNCKCVDDSMTAESYEAPIMPFNPQGRNCPSCNSWRQSFIGGVCSRCATEEKEAESFSAETFLANEMPFKSFWLVAKKASKSFPAGQVGELRLYENGERTIVLDNNLIIPFYNQDLAYAYLNEHFMVYPKKGNVDKGLLMGAEGDDHDHDHEDIDELIEKINRVTDFAITFIHDGGFGGEPKGFIVDEDLGLKTEIVNYVEGSIDLRLVRDLETNELMSVRFALTGDPDDTPILYLPLPEQLTTTPDEERAIKRS
jgi:hypothetical protein